MSIFQFDKKVKNKIPEFAEIEFPVSGFPVDALSGALYSLGCMGVHEVDQERWRVYFKRDFLTDNAAAMILKLKKLNPAFAAKDLHISELPHRNWNEEWRKYFHLIEPASEVWIRPPWEKLPPGAKGIKIIIDPQMAFGTGHHETTALMMRLMKEISFHRAAVLDIGTGSGILAILASKLGAGFVLAIDKDSDAIANTKHNMRLNRVSNVEIKCIAIESISKSQFQVILANIYYEVLSSAVSGMKEMLSKEGKLIVSGILKEEAPEIESLYQREGLRLLKQENLNEWTAMILQKRS
jgi:ribosomal protein L11 methyltransferase